MGILDAAISCLREKAPELNYCDFLIQNIQGSLIGGMAQSQGMNFLILS